MSAIFGLVGAHEDVVCRRALEVMRSALAAHGGDGSGIWALGGAGLGQQLKRVTPEDLLECQPAVSPDGLRVLVSDGRIDNRRELSHELGLRWPARSLPDSAFILASYERWGEDCGRHLVGSFSLAIWDARSRRALLLRSPFGAKPLFYHQGPGFVAFATMPRALFALPGVPRELRFQSIADHLALVPMERGESLFRGIRCLDPGHALTIDYRRGCRETAFWKPDLDSRLRLDRDEDYVEAFTERFDRVVADHLRSLSPVGLLLSGGLDSTSVAATAAPILARRSERLGAFTGSPHDGFRESSAPTWLVDEAPLASMVAARYDNVDLQVIRAEGLFLDGLDRFFDAAEMPFEGTASRVWYEAIMGQAHSRGIGVLLTGKCGNWTVSWNGSGLIRSLVGAGRWPTAWREARALAQDDRSRSAARALISEGFIPRLPWRLQLAIARHRGSEDPMVAPGAWWAPLSPIHPEFARAQNVGGRSRRRECDYWFRRRIDTPARRFDRLMHVQRIAGINGAYAALYGIDIRDPTSDIRIVEFCLSLPEDQYRRGGVRRWLIRRAMAGRLPDDILASRRRGIDTADWFDRLLGARTRVLGELRVLERNETARAVLDLARMRQLADQIDRPPADPVQRMMDYRHVLERGLMVGRFLLWFEGGSAAQRAS